MGIKFEHKSKIVKTNSILKDLYHLINTVIETNSKSKTLFFNLFDIFTRRNKWTLFFV